MYGGFLAFFGVLAFAATVLPTRLALRMNPTQAMAARALTRSAQGVRACDLAETPCARLDGALLGVSVDGDEAERRPVAEGPLEVVEERPVEVPADVDAGGAGRTRPRPGRAR